MAMRRGAKISLGILAGLIAILVIAVVLVRNYDWNKARPWLNHKVTEALGREFSIDGNLALSWHRRDPAPPGWRGWVPWPQLTAQDVRIANPEGFSDIKNFARAERLEFSVNPLALIGKEISIPLIEFEGPQVNFQRRSDKANNWTFKKREGGKWHLDLQAVAFKNGELRVIDAVRKADFWARLDSIDQASKEGYGIRYTLGGKIAGDAVSGSGKAGSVLSLQAKVAPYPIEADAHVGKSDISIKGTITRPSDLSAIDVQLKLKGLSMAQLFPISGITLPETPEFTTSGHLHGELDASGSFWDYRNFTGRMGGSDLAGSLSFDGRGKRHLLKGNVVSNQVRMADLAPLIGADNAASRKKREADLTQPADRLLPVEKFRTDRWDSMDADVLITGKKIVGEGDWPIDNIKAHVKMENAVLKLAPLDFGVAGGSVKSNITLDGKGKEIRAQLDLTGRNLALNKLFPKLEEMDTSLGALNADAKLTGSGSSIATILGASNGELKLLVDRGTISKLLLEKIGLNLGNIVLVSLSGDKQIRLNCVAGDFAVDRGLMRARYFIADAEDATLAVDGSVNLADEKIFLTMRPQTKGVRIITLRTPIHVTGTLKNPKAGIDKGVVALKAGAAIALAAVAPVAALLPLANLGKQTEEDCAKLLQEAREKPVAPPPGKSKPRAPSANTSAAR